MPVSGGAGRKVRSTRAPVCRPTPVVLIELLSVRCLSIAGAASPSLTCGADAIRAPAQGVSRGDTITVLGLRHAATVASRTPSPTNFASFFHFSTPLIHSPSVLVPGLHPPVF